MPKKGIYKLTNDRTGEVYIGQSQNLDSRVNRHFRELVKGEHHNSGIQKDHNRGDTFTFEVLKELPDASSADLKNMESHYVNKFNCFREGYNLTPGGAMDQFKGKYEYGGGRLPPEKYCPTEKYLSKVLGVCPKCGCHLINKTGIHGEFVGCDNFPKCEFTCSLDDVRYYIRIQSNNNKSSDSEFQNFCRKKNNYLTKVDCNYMAEKYCMDISEISTVKKANPIIRNHLKKFDLWEIAIKNLYEDIYSSEKHFSNQKYNDLDLKSSDNEQREPVEVNKSTSKPIAHHHSLENVMGNPYEFHNSVAPNKSGQVKNAESINSTDDENINYCSNCGFKIDLNEIYCGNCGERIDGKTKGRSIKKDKKSENNGNGIWATSIVIIIIIIAMLSLVISNTSDGPIASVASFIFVAILCFACFSSTD